jgi:hypothetical protein
MMERKRKYVPRKYRNAEKIEQEMIARLQTGETLSSICRDAHMPDTSTVDHWVKNKPGFADAYARARQIGFDAIADSVLTIADTPMTGEETEEDAEGNVLKIKKAEMLGHRKLQVWTRLQLLARWCPERYGDRNKIEMSGSLNVSAMSDDDLRAELAAITQSIRHAAAKSET